MGTVYNIRGTNGAGKTTLARAFLPTITGDLSGGPVDLVWYDAPTKKDPGRRLRTEGYGRYLENPAHREPFPVGIVGPYRTATGGMDNIPSFDLQQASILDMLKRLRCQSVIAEGVLSSTVYGSWAVFDKYLETIGHTFAWVYLNTPLDVCFERIAQRQAASGKVRDIKRDLVEDKFRAIQATRTKAIADGRVVYDLPYGQEVMALTGIIQGLGEHHRLGYTNSVRP